MVHATAQKDGMLVAIHAQPSFTQFKKPLIG